MIRAVLFDLDGTLFDRDATVFAVAETQYAAFGDKFPQVQRQDFVARLIHLDDHGHGDKVRVYETLVRELAVSYAFAETLVADFWRRYHLCAPFPDTLDTLEKLRQSGRKIGLVTNGKQVIQNVTIDALGIRSHLDTILISEVEGVRKPDLEIFERALTRLGVVASEACYVGDHPDVDVGGARSAGLRAFWKRVPYWREPTDVPALDTLGQIMDYLSP